LKAEKTRLEKTIAAESQRKFPIPDDQLLELASSGAIESLRPLPEPKSLRNVSAEYVPVSGRFRILWVVSHFIGRFHVFQDMLMVWDFLHTFRFEAYSLKTSTIPLIDLDLTLPHLL